MDDEMDDVDALIIENAHLLTTTPEVESRRQVSNDAPLTGRPPIQLYLSCDDDHMSPYQVLVRKQVELFEAGWPEVDSSTQGRNKAIVMGQVGIRCRHCAHLDQKTKGAVYFPSKLDGLYQAGQNMATQHLCESCPAIPEDLRAEMCRLKENGKITSGGGGKAHWAHAAANLGVYEDADGLRFTQRLGSNVRATLLHS